MTTSLAAQLEQKTDQLAAIREISQAIAEAKDLSDTLDLITRRTTEVMQVQSCSVYLYNKFSDKLILRATTGLNKEAVGEKYLPRGYGLTGWAAEHRQPVAVTDAFSDHRFHRMVGSGESRFQSLMAMPLISHGKVIGAVNVQTNTAHEYTEEEIELFGFITELAAIAIDKAQMVNTARIQEMHHRVKNNLETIAMLLRLEMGQNRPLSPHDILNETISRVLSIATVHEILSETGIDTVGALDLLKRMARMIAANMVNPSAQIHITVDGTNPELPSSRVTSLALITNELLQNGLEHGMAGRMEGNIAVRLDSDDDMLTLTVQDDGNGLTPGFNPDTDLNLGLEIVHTMVTEDLQGQFCIKQVSPEGGTAVTITIPITVMNDA